MLLGVVRFLVQNAQTAGDADHAAAVAGHVQGGSGHIQQDIDARHHRGDLLVGQTHGCQADGAHHDAAAGDAGCTGRADHAQDDHEDQLPRGEVNTEGVRAEEGVHRVLNGCTVHVDGGGGSGTQVNDVIGHTVFLLRDLHGHRQRSRAGLGGECHQDNGDNVLKELEGLDTSEETEQQGQDDEHVHQRSTPQGENHGEDLLQVLDAGGAHQVGDQAEHAVGGDGHNGCHHSLHDEVAALHDHGDHVHGIGVLTHLGDHHAKEDSKNDDLHQRTVGERGEHVVGDPAHDVVHHVNLLYAGVHCRLQYQTSARAADGNGETAQNTCHSGGDEGIQQELTADLLQLGDVRHVCDTGDDAEQHQGVHTHFQESNEQGANECHIRSLLLEDQTRYRTENQRDRQLYGDTELLLSFCCFTHDFSSS